MPYNLLLLPLLGGYLLVSRSYLFAFHTAKHSGERLIFMSALAAVILLALARVLIVALIALFPVAGEWWRVVMPWEYSGTAALALVLGYMLSFAINCLHPKEKASKRTVQNNGDGLDRLLFEATQGEHQIAVTLATGKVYAGWLDWTPPNPGAADAYIRILPTMSGYRDAEQVVQWTTFYQDVYLALEEFDETGIESLTKVIPVSQVITAGLFDPATYNRFNPQQPLPDDEQPAGAA